MPSTEVGVPPLTGLRVLDFTRVIAGPYSTMMLADLGAEIVKVETPGLGDDCRHFSPQGCSGDAPIFVYLNRHKQSVAINIATHEGRELCLKLAARADILIENFRPDVMERHGLDYGSLSVLNPRLVYCSISGYGNTGPYRLVPGYDPIAQAEAGLMYITGPAELEPQKVGGAVADVFAGLHATVAILAALRARDSHGHGQYIDVALYESMVAAMGFVGQVPLITGGDPERVGNGSTVLSPMGNYDCADGQIAVIVGNDAQWRRFCSDVIRRQELMEDARFASIQSRARHKAEIEAIVRPIFASMPRADWIRRFRAASVPAGEIRSPKEALASAEVAARGTLHSVEHPTHGRIGTVGSPLRLSANPVRPPNPAPLLGQHTDAVLRDLLGLESEAISTLRAAQIVA